MVKTPKIASADEKDAKKGRHLAQHRGCADVHITHGGIGEQRTAAHQEANNHKEPKVAAQGTEIQQAALPAVEANFDGRHEHDEGRR
jgi:hypothetical protein